jgi:hypothetical protein
MKPYGISRIHGLRRVFMVSQRRRARMAKVAFGAAAILVIVLVIAWLYRSGPSRVQPEVLPTPPTQKRAAALGETPMVGEVRSTDDARTPAPPPVVFAIGPSDPNDAPDLSTPSQAVYSVLGLLDRSEMETLSRCFAEKAPGAGASLYPRYLGSPVELVDVIEEGSTAKVVWNATVHKAFTYNGKCQTPGETVTLTTCLVQIDDLWKLLRLHEGGDWHDISAN